VQLDAVRPGYPKPLFLFPRSSLVLLLHVLALSLALSHALSHPTSFAPLLLSRSPAPSLHDSFTPPLFHSTALFLYRSFALPLFHSAALFLYRSFAPLLFPSFTAEVPCSAPHPCREWRPEERKERTKERRAVSRERGKSEKER